MTKLKIFLVGTAYPYRGGIADFNFLLSKTLKKRGHQVEIITFKRQYPDLLFPGKSQYEEDERRQVATRRLIDSVNPINWWRVGRWLAAEAPDLVIFHHWMPFFGPAFSTIAKRLRKAGAKILFICHNIFPHESRPLDTFLTRQTLKNSDFFIVLSEKEKRDLERLLPQPKVKMVHHPVYEIFESGLTPAEARKKLGLRDEFVALFFGYIRKYKGLKVLIEAVALAKEKINIRLLVAGEFYDDEEKYREQIRRLSLNDHIIMQNNFIPSDELGTYFLASDVVVLPYLSASQSGIIQICYNYDKPVIASRVGGLPEFVDEGKTGLLVPPDDPQALADALVEFCQKGYSEPFSQNVKEYKKRFSWENMAEEIEGFLSF